jgi:hypothetical protein
MDVILFCSPQEQTSWIWPSTRMYGLYHYNKPSFFTFCSTKLWLARWPPGFQNVFDFVDIIVLSHSDHSIDSTTGPRRGWMWYTTTQMETLVSTMASRVPKCLWLRRYNCIISFWSQHPRYCIVSFWSQHRLYYLATSLIRPLSIVPMEKI